MRRKFQNEEDEGSQDDSQEKDLSVSRYFHFDQLVAVAIKPGKQFLWIVETLTRVGKQKDKTITQVCYILHKKENYYIVHVNELKKLNGEHVTISENDIAERNLIVQLLIEWGLISVNNPNQVKFPVAPIRTVRIISKSEKDKGNWELISPCQIGKFV